ncbi:conserved hypothetical protein [[Clostridium] ultunense Esp]|uniref:hypothetical protein n=1 Tax=Thermicanus aegyptius TaxID=94009 RepID=UPI0002B6F616|nr:hypothetical protein [Thermicanus aegyptius]CCQ98698.1 conserved hypothetical protein [[Clostridium] ultunense Esp]
MRVAFVGIRKDKDGRITHFLTDQGNVISFKEAERLVREGYVDSLTEIHEDGSWKMDLPTAREEGNNLDDLPEF